MMALITEQTINFSGYQRDVILSDCYYWLRSMLNRVYYATTTQNTGLVQLAQAYWNDAVHVTGDAHRLLPQYSEWAWSDPNGVIDFLPEDTRHSSSAHGDPILQYWGTRHPNGGPPDRTRVHYTSAGHSTIIPQPQEPVILFS
jgi:hypothetical protein